MLNKVRLGRIVISLRYDVKLYISKKRCLGDAFPDFDSFQICQVEKPLGISITQAPKVMQHKVGVAP